MIQSAKLVTPSAYPADAPVCYEQPLGERMRTFLRLEYLYQQLIAHREQPSPWAARMAVTSLLDIIAILMRGDLRGDILKELERQIYAYDRYQGIPDVDEDKVEGVLQHLKGLREELNFVGPQYLTSLRENEFLNAIKHRSSIPGGTCEFDLPDYSYWLRLPCERRLADFQIWMKTLRPLCDSITELMWLLRSGGQTLSQVATKGVFQYAMGRDVSARLLRVSLAPGTALYPEISGSHHRFTIRFMDWSNVDRRAMQTTHDIDFNLTIC
ncbi:MAG: cell division protein ZapD [Gammaproteobacteria bacterium]|nr:MAG: cell division protein ZapD [Gammaproteobacteria bacterium]